jgi:hypothetical protein
MREETPPNLDERIKKEKYEEGGEMTGGEREEEDDEPFPAATLWRLKHETKDGVPN